MKTFVTGTMLLVAAMGFAQTEGSDFTSTGRGVASPFVTDYHTLGINPANLDLPSSFEGKIFTLGLFEIGASVFSEVLSKDEVRRNLYRQEIVAMTPAEQRNFARQFANSRTSIDIDVMLVGMAYQTSMAGSFGFSVRDRFDYTSIFGPLASEIAVLGYGSPYFINLVLENGTTVPNTEANLAQHEGNIEKGVTPANLAKPVSEVIKGTNLSTSWIREFNLGYGKSLISNEDGSAIYAGIGIKYLLGNAMLRVMAEGDGEAYAYSALSPVFDIDYSDIDEPNPSLLPTDAPPLKPVGSGFGIDLGVTMKLRHNWIFSAAINDIGSMKWNGNLFQLNDLLLTEYANTGIESVDFYDQITSLNGSDAVIQWTGLSEYKTSLPTVARLGAGFKAKEWMSVGAELVLPVSGNTVGQLDKPVLAIGGDLSPLPIFRFSLGFVQGGNYDFKIPAGVAVVFGNGTYEAGVSSRDMITFFSDNQPTVSAALGFLRFRF